MRFPKRRNYIIWNYSRGIGDALHFPKFQSEQLPEPSNSPVNWKQLSNLSKPNASQKRVLWREIQGIWKEKRTYDRLGKSLQERARLNTILWDFPREEIILGVVEISCTSQKLKWAAARTIQLAQKLEKKMKNLSKPNASQKWVLWREMKGIWEK